MVGLATGVYVVTLAGTVFPAAIAVYAHRNRDRPMATEFRNLMIAAAGWGCADSLLLSPFLVDRSLLLYGVSDTLSVIVAAFVFVFVAEYTQYDTLNRTRVRKSVWASIALGSAVGLTNWNQVAFASGDVVRVGGVTFVSLSYQPVWAVYSAFAYSLMLVSFAALARFMLDTTNVYRKQTALIFTGFLVVVLGTVVEFTSLVPVSADLGPALQTIAGVLIWAAIYKYDFLTVMPLAKDTLIDTIETPVVILDEEGTVTYANDAAGRIGLSQRDVDRPLDAVLPGLADSLDGDDAVYAADGGSAIENAEKLFRPNVTPIVDQYGVERGEIVILHDITAQKKREQRLEEFASIVSHDLRNPLNVAHGRVELERERRDSEHLDAALESLERMDQLIEDLLTLAREGYDDFETESVDLSAVVERAWQNVATDGATLERDDADRIVESNEGQLQEMLENLIRNAVEHNDDPVTICVGTTEWGFYVEDDGSGIDDPQQVLQAGYTSGGGTGMGLYVVSRFADAHGWDLSVTDGEDGGARFEFRVDT